MPKKAKAPPAPKGGGAREDAFKAAMGGLALMVAAAGMPPQVRLASREQQPLTKSAPTKSAGGGGKGRGKWQSA
jgi:hypothetical protein